jgi:hypothetical protein
MTLGFPAAQLGLRRFPAGFHNHHWSYISIHSHGKLHIYNGLLINSMVIFHGKLLNNQMVCHKLCLKSINTVVMWDSMIKNSCRTQNHQHWEHRDGGPCNPGCGTWRKFHFVRGTKSWVISEQSPVAQSADMFFLFEYFRYYFTVGLAGHSTRLISRILRAPLKQPEEVQQNQTPLVGNPISMMK